jgi:hypothetical protein
MFPGIHERCVDLQRWDWIFGKTPKFTIEQEVKIPDVSATYKLHISKGLISRVDLEGTGSNLQDKAKDLGVLLTGVRFERNALAGLLQNFGVQSVLLDKPVIDSIFWDILRNLS